MSDLKYFTLTGYAKTVIADSSDEDFDPETTGVYGRLTITPKILGYPVMRADDLTPPTLLVLGAISAVLDNGRVKLRSTQDDVRLVAKCSALGIGDASLTYTLTPSSVTAGGMSVSLPTITFEAPTVADDWDDEIDGEVVIDLTTVEWLSTSAVSGGGYVIRHVPDDVRLVGDSIQFYAAGSELGEALDISGVVSGAAIHTEPEKVSLAAGDEFQVADSAAGWVARKVLWSTALGSVASASMTLTGKTISGASNTLSDIPQSAVTSLTTDLSGKAAASHTHAQADITNLVTDLSGKEPTISAGTTAQYWRGDKSWQTLDKSAVGLGNVDNTSDATKDAANATLTNKTISGASNTLSDIGNSALTNSAITIAGTSTSLGGSISQDTITGLSTTGLVKRTGANTLGVASAGTDFVAPGGELGTPSSGTLTNCTGLPVAGIAASTVTALGVGSVELGHASDTTLTRVSAGVLAVEGVTVATASNTLTLTNKTLTSPTITNPLQGFSSESTSMTSTSSKTLTVSSPRFQYFTGAGSGLTLTLPTTSVAEGYEWEIINQGTTRVTVVASGGATVAMVASLTQCRIVANTATPTTAAHWTPIHNLVVPTSEGDDHRISVNGALAFTGTNWTTMILPSASTTLVGTDSVQTLTSKTLTTPTITNPKISGDISDPNANTNLRLGYNANAVNFVQIDNKPTGIAPVIWGWGGDANVGLDLRTKGTGQVQLNGVAAVDVSSAQTLTSKTLTSPTISSAALTGTAHAIASGGSLSLYNTADQTTNYEKLLLNTNSNTFQIASTNGGTGVIRPIFIGSGTSGLTVDTQSNTVKSAIAIDSGVAGVKIFNVAGQLAASSGTQYSASVAPTINQSSTAGYTALLVNPTQTATGSGAKLLADFQVGGVSKASIDNTGVITSAGATVVTTTGTATLTNKTLNLASNTLSGTLAQFNTAMSDYDFASLVGNQLQGVLCNTPASAGYSPIGNIFNEIAFNTYRGGVTTVTKNGGAASFTFSDNMFRPGASGVVSFAYMNPVVTGDVIVITVDLCKTFSWGNTWGISMPDYCRAKDVTIEIYYSGGWHTIHTVTNSATGDVFKYTSESNANAITGVRYTLTNLTAFNSELDITQLWVVGGAVPNPAGLLARNGGAIYGTAAAPPTFTATSVDSNVSIDMVPKGSGTLNVSGVPVVTTTGTVTLTNKTLTSPIIGTSILDTNGNAILGLSPIASAVNYLQIQNAITAANPHLIAVGSDANISMSFQGKGTGGHRLNNTNGIMFRTVQSTATIANYITATGEASGTNPKLTTAFSADTNVSLNLATKGTGQVLLNNVAAVDVSSAQTLTSKTLTTPTMSSPKISDGLIKDTNGNTALSLTAVASAVNYVNISNGVDSTVLVSGAGSGSDVGIKFQPKGFGVLSFNDQNGIAVLQTQNGAASAVNYLTVGNAATGNPAKISAAGSDTNVSINMVPKGSGTVQANGVDVVTTTGTATLTGKTLTEPKLSTATPASASATGTTGTVVWDASYIYVCTATDTWKRAAIATW